MQEKFIVRRMEPRTERDVHKVTRTPDGAMQPARHRSNPPAPRGPRWMFGLGLNIGVLLVLKSALMMWIARMGLTPFGWLTIASQVALGCAFIVGGAFLRRKEANNSARTVRRCMWLYLLAGLEALVVSVLKNALELEFFRSPKGLEWFVNLFTGTYRGLKESGMELLFVDRILWIILAFVLCSLAGRHAKELAVWEKKARHRKRERRALQRAS